MKKKLEESNLETVSAAFDFLSFCADLMKLKLFNKIFGTIDEMAGREDEDDEED